MKVIISLFILFACVAGAFAACGYNGTCSPGGVAGVCVSVSKGCCSGGTAHPGYCPGSSDNQCCIAPACSTPEGSGNCVSTSACSGKLVPGYCAGPSNIECCVGGHGGCTVGSIGGCDSHGPTAGLNAQIVAELNAMGHTFRALNGNNVHCTGGCVLQDSAASALEKAAASKGDFITLSSAFRSCAEQYLLYNWYKAKQLPGQSNHEGGRAVDTPNYNYWISTLAAYGFTHSYPSTDPVHFDYFAAADLDSQNLLAFQRIYNRHNTNKIAEDGQYGPATEAALHGAPCNGW